MGSQPIVALIHGGFHGSWCWDRLLPELQERGYRTSAVDLPIADTELGADAYADAVAADLPHNEDVVVVAHSLGGLVAPLLTGRRNVVHMVFIAARYPVPGMSLNEQYVFKSETLGAMGNSSAHFGLADSGLLTLSPESARYLFYHDCEEELAEWAASKISNQSPTIMAEKTPLKSWPNVPVSFIACTQDRCIPIAWARQVAERRFGVDTTELDCGHSPFLTCPDKLAEALDRVMRRGQPESAAT